MMLNGPECLLTRASISEPAVVNVSGAARFGGRRALYSAAAAQLTPRSRSPPLPTSSLLILGTVLVVLKSCTSQS